MEAKSKLCDKRDTKEIVSTYAYCNQMGNFLLEKDNWINLIDSTNLFHDSKDFLQKFLLIKCLRNPNFFYTSMLRRSTEFIEEYTPFFNQILKNNRDLFVISLLENCVYDCYFVQITDFIRKENRIKDDKEILNELLQTPKQFKSRADSLLQYINNLSIFMEKSTQLFDQNKLKETRNIINSYQKALEILISKKEENERYSVDDGDIEIISIKNDNSNAENHDNDKKNRKLLEIIKRWLFPGIGIVGIFALLGYAIKKSMSMKK